MTMQGSLACADSSVLRIEVGDSSADVLNVLQTLTIDGNLDVHLLGQMPPAGSSYVVITAGAVAGQATFDNFVDGRVDFDGGSAAVSIADGSVTLEDFQVELSPAEAWRAAHFTLEELADPLISGWEADADGDGCTNLWEFATKTLPKDPGSRRVAVSSVSGGHFLMSYVRREGGTESPGAVYEVDGLTYTPQCTPNLLAAAWNSGSSSFQIIGDPVANGDGTETVTVRLLSGIGEQSRQFCRMGVQLAP
jgi:hypothetical protein